MLNKLERLSLASLPLRAPFYLARETIRCQMPKLTWPLRQRQRKTLKYVDNRRSVITFSSAHKRPTNTGFKKCLKNEIALK
jgi:hypothetical protein